MPTHPPFQALAHAAQVLAARPQLAARTIFKLTALYGRGLYLLKLGRVRRVQGAGGPIYIKARHRRSALLVGAGNACLKLWRGELLGLPERDWLAWEQQVGALAWPQDVSSRVRVEGRSLLCPALPGEPLGVILRSNRSLQSRLRAVEIASLELQRLQRFELRFPDGGWRSWSHGDAHAGNVVVDVEHHAAWFDFETVHAAWCPRLWRQADDLRALAYSCAAACRASEYEALARIVARSIGGPCLRQELLRQSGQLQRRARAFHLAQAPLGWAEHQEFGHALQEALQAELEAARIEDRSGEAGTQVRAASTWVRPEAALSGGKGGACALEFEPTHKR